MAIILKPTDNVKLKNGSNIFVIKDKYSNSVWRKCKPVTCIFDETKISEIQFSGVGDDFAYHSGDTVYLPCGDEYEYSVHAEPKSGYVVTSDNDFILDLTDISSLTLSDFDPVTYTFEATAAENPGYLVTIPAKTAYISSAVLAYTRNGAAKTISLTSSEQTTTVDAGTSIYYSSITPVSGYTANYSTVNVFLPDRDDYAIPALKVFPKKPTITATVTSGTSTNQYKYYITITNPNPYKLYCRVNLSNTPVADPTTANDYLEINGNSTLVYPDTPETTIQASGSFTIYAKACLDVYNKNGNAISSLAATNMDGSSGVISSTTQYGSTST